MKNSPSLPVRGGLSRQRGWRMPSNTAKVCRPGPWGNPHKAGVAPLQLSANEAIAAYEADHLYLVTEPEIVVPHEVPVGWGWLAGARGLGARIAAGTGAASDGGGVARAVAGGVGAGGDDESQWAVAAA